MKKTYGFGIIGCGMIADFHAKAIKDLTCGNLIAVSSRSSMNSQRFVNNYGVKAYTDYHELLKNDNIDIVCICTPSGLHMEPAVATAISGKHVIVEKPLEITLKRCDKIINTCLKNNVRICPIFNSRFSDSSKLIKKTVSDGRLGQLILGDVFVKWYRSQDYYDSGDWRGTKDLDGGGTLMNQSIHAIDFLQYVMGPVKSVQAFTDTLAHDRIDVEDVAVASLKFNNGALGVIEATTAVYPGSLKRFEFSGTKGTIVMEEESIVKWDFDEEKNVDKEIRKKFSQNNSGGGVSDPTTISHVNHFRQMTDFINSIEKNEPHLIDGYEGRKAVEIILAIYESSKFGKIVHLPL
ncbi:MAG: Gfo/Idh/MocA family protein [Candidatus Neomarinimicrobiota bacterium]